MTSYLHAMRNIGGWHVEATENRTIAVNLGDAPDDRPAQGLTGSSRMLALD